LSHILYHNFLKDIASDRNIDLSSIHIVEVESNSTLRFIFISFLYYSIYIHVYICSKLLSLILYIILLDNLVEYQALSYSYGIFENRLLLYYASMILPYTLEKVSATNNRILLLIL
jgi:hypothetical protein